MCSLNFLSVPGRPPMNASWSPESSRSILLRWGQVPEEFRNGVIRGYKVEYQEAKPNVTARVMDRQLATWAIIRELKKFTIYFVRLSAYTTLGDGPRNNFTVMTAQDGKTLKFQSCIIKQE